MKNIILFFASACVVISLYIVIVFYNTYLANPPRFQNSEIWLKDTYRIKDYINSKPTDRQRLLIVGGSNSLFGFDGALIDSHTSFRPINYGTHAGLPINYHIDKIIEVAKEGDSVFMPLEFNYYTRSEPTSDYWYIHNMLTWGNGYKRYLTTSNVLLSYIKNKPETMMKFFIKGLMRKAPQEINPITTMEALWQQETQKYVGYDYKSLNKYGDICGHSDNKFKDNAGYLDSHLKISSFFLSEYNRLLEFAKANNIKVFLTYPATLENKDFSLNDPKTFEKIENLKAELKKHNIEIYGDFRDFHFRREYFFDTSYHLNSEGAALRTQAFIRLLEQMQERGLL